VPFRHLSSECLHLKGRLPSRYRLELWLQTLPTSPLVDKNPLRSFNLENAKS
jgi:hypothetical protein